MARCKQNASPWGEHPDIRSKINALRSDRSAWSTGRVNFSDMSLGALENIGGRGARRRPRVQVSVIMHKEAGVPHFEAPFFGQLRLAQLLKSPRVMPLSACPTTGRSFRGNGWLPKGSCHWGADERPVGSVASWPGQAKDRLRIVSGNLTFNRSPT